MSKITRAIRDRNTTKQLFAYLVLFWSFLGILMQMIRALMSVHPLGYLLLNYVYFTTQSNLLLIVVSSLFLFSKKRGMFYTSIAFIALINIGITAVVFHTLLIPFMGSVSFLNHILHTITPILYILFYFLVIEEHPPLKKFWLALVYPLVYLLFVYLFVEPLIGDYMDNIMTTFDSARYVYPFLDPSNYDQGIKQMLLFNLGVLAPIITLFSFVLCWFKNWFESKHTNFKS
ncbi:MAG: hypothetical protein WC992_07840 [Acholeplasmataceae bacterium]|jgi:hypothetical protein|nr:hypothetical protein [Acholeplasmataceae bacterium]